MIDVKYTDVIVNNFLKSAFISRVIDVTFSTFGYNKVLLIERGEETTSPQQGCLIKVDVTH